jgi:hypothetical protein
MNVSNEVNAVLPKHDHKEEFATSTKKTKTGFAFTDTPTQTFLARLVRGAGKDQAIFEIREIRWVALFFLAFVAKLPSGSFGPLSTLFWGITHCEKLAPGGFLSEGPESSIETESPSKTCRNCQNCRESEPGFLPLGPVPQSCLEAVSRFADLPGRELSGTIPTQGPGNFTITCP